METLSALLALCAGNSPVSGEFPAQRPVTRSFDVFFDLRLIKRLSKHSRGWWFETLSSPLWRHCNEYGLLTLIANQHHVLCIKSPWHRYGTTFAQVMACYLRPQSHYLSHCWHVISGILWHLSERNFAVTAHAAILNNQLKLLKLLPSPRGPMC